MNSKHLKYSFFSNLRYIFINVWKYDKLLFIFFTINSMLNALYPLVIAFFPKLIIDELLTNRRIKYLVSILILFLITTAITEFFTSLLQSKCTLKIIMIRAKFLKRHSMKCMTTDFVNTEDKEFLNNSNKALKAIEEFNYGLEGMLRELFRFGSVLLAFAGYSVVILTFNPWVLIYLVISVVIMYIFNLRVKNYEYSKRDEVSNLDRHINYLNNTMCDFLYGKDIRIYNISKWISNKFIKFTDEKMTINKSIYNKYYKSNLLNVVFSFIREGIVYFYLIYLMLNNKITIGSFVMYVSVIESFSGWLLNVISSATNLHSQNMYICDLREFLEENNYNKKNQEHNEYDCNNLTVDEVEFRNVSFKYPNSEKYVLKNFSLKINRDEKLAIVGRNGAGKTTIIKLLCRLYSPTEGEILINGINIERFSTDEYNKLLSVVFQEVKIFAFSVAENVALCKEKDINFERVYKVLKKVGLSSKIKGLSNGTSTSMLKFLDEDGVEFSGGENQRLAISRAIYKNGDIVILDEPTSALDALAEYEIYNNFNNIMNGNIGIYISHRLSSTRFCSNIILLEDGQVVENGTHNELLNLNGKYAELFNIQAKYYR